MRYLLKKQWYSSTAEYGLMLNPKGISGCKTTPEDVRSRKVAGCKVTPDNVARRESGMQNSPSKITTDHSLHASDLQLSNWQGQEMNDTTQVFEPGMLDEIDNYFSDYPAS